MVLCRHVSNSSYYSFKISFSDCCTIRTQKDGDWYIYPQFLAHENHKIAHKNALKSFINFKPRIGNVAITETNFAPQSMTLCVTGRVRLERNCGKMYSRHLFPYGGFPRLFQPAQQEFRCGSEYKSGEGMEEEMKETLAVQTNPGIKMCKKKVDCFISLISHSP